MSKKKKNNAIKYAPCHAVTEIFENLFIGGYSQMKEMIYKGVNCFFPLDSVDGIIWDYGWRGEIHYYPILDFETLPEDVLDKCVTEIIECLIDGKKVGIFCLGGHGRTGYIAACVLGKLGIKDPIEYLRKYYCSKAIESNAQVVQISEYIGNPELKDLYHMKELSYGGFGNYGNYYGFSDYPYK